MFKKTNADAKPKHKKTAGQVLQEKMFPVMMRVANMRGLTTVRDAFGLLTPLILGGAICLLITIIIFGGSGGTSTSLLGLIAKGAGGVIDNGGGNWQFIGAWKTVSDIGSKIFSVATDCTINAFGILVSFEIAFIFAKTMGFKDPVMCGTMGTVAFLISTFAFSNGNSLFIGTAGLFPAMFVSFFAAYIFNLLLNSNLMKIKMPKGTPPMVAKGFAYLFPIIFSLMIFGAINAAFWAIGYYNNIDITQQKLDSHGNSYTAVIIAHGDYGFTGLFYKFICWPFLNFAGTGNAGIGLAEFYQFFIGFFWFFGINGSSVLNGVFSPIWTSLIMENTASVAAKGYDMAYNSGMLNPVTGTFLENYAQTSGWGQTGGLLLATWLFGKTKQHREVTKIAAIPAAFGINEPVTFGFPIMLDPILGIGAMFVMPITTGLSYLFVVVFHWARITYLMVPWTLPPGIGALLATGLDWRAMLISWALWLVAFGYYIPIVLVYNKWNEMRMASGKDQQSNMSVLAGQDEDSKDLDQLFSEQELRRSSKNKTKKPEENHTSTTQPGNELILAPQKVGGYKLKLNGKTVAAAINDQQLKMMVQELIDNNNVVKIITQDADGNVIKEQTLE